MRKDLKPGALSPEKDEGGHGGSQSPKSIQKTITELFAASVTSRPVFHPLFEKLDGEHITQLLENA